jgi:SHS2 domain-containing protein
MLNSESYFVRKFEEIEHTADWAYRVRGSDLRELFIQAAQGLYFLVGMELTPGEKTTKSIEVQAIDRESLLVAWLNELLYFHESENLGFDQLDIEYLDERKLIAQVTGASTQEWQKDIKAVTYHNLAIKENSSELEVTLVLDV